MITDIIKKYENGDVILLDSLIEMELLRASLENELNALKNFKYENSVDIEVESKEYDGIYMGHKFEVRSGKKTWNFKGIEEWETYNKSKSDCEKRYKALFEAKVVGAVHANISEDGEELQLPTISYGKPSVLIKEIV